MCERKQAFKNHYCCSTKSFLWSSRTCNKPDISSATEEVKKKNTVTFLVLKTVAKSWMKNTRTQLTCTDLRTKKHSAKGLTQKDEIKQRNQNQNSALGFAKGRDWSCFCWKTWRMEFNSYGYISRNITQGKLHCSQNWKWWRIKYVLGALGSFRVIIILSRHIS